MPIYSESKKLLDIEDKAISLEEPTIMSIRPRESVFINQKLKSNLDMPIEKIYAPGFSSCVLLLKFYYKA